jgi:hypothetical protein
MKLPPRVAHGLLGAVIAVLLISVATEMTARYRYEASGAFNGDSPIYWAVGRGVANGYRMYDDLFDIKPPFIFLLSAASVRASGDLRIGHAAQGIVIAVLPLLCIVPWALVRRRQLERGRFLTGLLCVTGFAGAMSFYTGIHGGEFQTESFGVFFGIIYLGCILAARERDGWFWPAVAAVPLFLAVFTKEPFALSCALAGLVLCRSPRDVLRLVVIPAIIGAALFWVALFAIGAAGGYVEYLRFMTAARTQRFGSPFSRAMLIEMIAYNTWSFSPLFTVFLAAVWLWLLHRALRTDIRDAADMGLFAAFLLSLAAVSYGIQSMRIVPGVEIRWRPVQSPFWLGLGLLGLAAAWRRIIRPWPDKATMSVRIGMVLMALLGIGYMTGLSGEFVGHHFLFAVPVYTALVYVCTDALAFSDLRRDRISAGALAGLIALAVLLPHQKTPYEERHAAWGAEAERDRALAAVIDSVLDRCNADRYLIVGEAGTNVFGYTRHSPLGPVFFQHTLVTEYRSFTELFAAQLEAADVILIRWYGGRPTMPGVDDYIHRNFTDASVCAGPLPIIEGGQSILVRTQEEAVELLFETDGSPRIAGAPAS